MIFFRFVIIALAAMLLAACDKTKGGNGITSPTSTVAVVTEVSVSTPNLSITLNACPATIGFTATVRGTNVTQTVTWAATGNGTFMPSGTTANLVVRTAGVYVVTARATQNANISGSVTVTATGIGCAPASPPPSPPGPPGPSPPPPGVVSVNVEPNTFTCVVGSQTILEALVQVTGGASTAVAWSISDTTVVSVETTVGNQVVLRCLKIGSVTVTARSVVDSSKSDSVSGSVTPGTISCTWSPASGLQPDGSVEIAFNQTIAATAVCLNQYGQNFLPFWYSSDPSRVGVAGEQSVTIGGHSYPAGTSATIRGIWIGQAIVTVQAAIPETSPSFSRTVTVK